MRPFALLLALCATPALAQSALPTGPWTGTIEWANAAPVALTGDIEECTEGLKIRLGSEDGAYGTEEVLRVEDATAEGAAFQFGLENTRRGYRLTCTAARQGDGLFAGRCQTADGTWARLRLEPPAVAMIGCSE
ncbi:MAG: hypothetical protein R3181_01190 [Rubricoccaceae bacterium]|nr:hypothetical protein [Rubricoccaceae bacterium]